MEHRACQGCGAPINLSRSDAVTCSTRCRVRVHRAAKKALIRPVFGDIPLEMRDIARWVRWSEQLSGKRMTKVPKRADSGRNASSIDPATWATFDAVAISQHGQGLGFVLNGDGVTCIDLDKCMVDGVPTVDAMRVMGMFPGAWVEVSPSGTGLHIWGRSSLRAGRVFTTPDGLSVEVYPTGRYLTVTGNTYRSGGLSECLDEVLSFKQ